MKKYILIAVIVLIVGVLAWYFLKGKDSGILLSNDQKKQKIKDYVASKGTGETFPQIDSMTPDEVSDVFKYFFEYVKPGKTLPPSNSLYARISAISTKYNVFT